MLPSGVNKIIQEYCYYKPEYLSDLEWWKPESMRNEFLEYFSDRNTTFMDCDNHCRESIKYCDLNTAICEECIDDIYTTYIYLYLNKRCCSCRNKKSLIYCDYCLRKYCFDCRGGKVVLDDGNDPICESCSVKMENKSYRSIIKYPCIFPNIGFLDYLELKSKLKQTIL